MYASIEKLESGLFDVQIGVINHAPTAGFKVPGGTLKRMFDHPNIAELLGGQRTKTVLLAKWGCHEYDMPLDEPDTIPDGGDDDDDEDLVTASDTESELD